MKINILAICQIVIAHFISFRPNKDIKSLLQSAAGSVSSLEVFVGIHVMWLGTIMAL